MKKLIVAIIAMLYLGSSSGATLHLHYCMGELAQATIELGEKDGRACEFCGMPKSSKQAGKKGCCKDEHKSIQLSKDQKAAGAYISFLHAAAAIEPVQYAVANMVALPSIARSFPVANAPPSSSQPPIYLRNRVFLI
ncbi:HYC_CC_PP family protein [Deminuibacter soli]|uniref:Secreted protein n=1 Tax=Deminuibacter soli TaxID=2291815 RepID=A0A3E1NI77_9BACT|nr:hypothetical protein [Deminuibacter soli]RFM27488.1 hypothetical protein DXN05_15870 [Deminuibacter soli]